MGRDQDRVAQAELERRRLERAERARLRLEAMMEESDRLRREMDELLKGEGYKDVLPPKPLPLWPTLGHVLSTAGVYSGIAVSFALLFVIGALIYSFPVTVTSFAAGILATVMGVRLWRLMLRRGLPLLLDRVRERFNWSHYARY